MPLSKPAIATLCLAAYFLLDALLWFPIFEFSNSVTKKMQSINNNYLEAFFLILTFFGYGTAFGLLLIFLWLKASNKIEVIKIFSMLSICAYIMGVLKIIYSVPPHNQYLYFK